MLHDIFTFEGITAHRVFLFHYGMDDRPEDYRVPKLI